MKIALNTRAHTALHTHHIIKKYIFKNCHYTKSKHVETNTQAKAACIYIFQDFINVGAHKLLLHT